MGLFTGDPRLGLLGRRSEREVLAQLLDDVRAARSRVLVLRGEPGVGKTALLEHLARTSSGCRVVRAAHDAATAALQPLEERTRAVGTDWALGVRARSRALLSDGHAAESAYREAIERLERSRVAVHLARAHLLYGEWLRREHRLVDARAQLRVAHEMLGRFGAEAFAERARRELLAAGETTPKRTFVTREALTAQEGQIARLATEGYTNPEIGSQLFISPRTVEYYLSKVFTKLRVSSRRELRNVLPNLDRTPSPN